MSAPKHALVQKPEPDPDPNCVVHSPFDDSHQELPPPKFEHDLGPHMPENYYWGV